MKFAVKPLAAVVALTLSAGFSSGAFAANYPFVMPVAPATPFAQLVSVTGPTFSDTFTFTAPVSAVEVSGSVISIDISPFYNVDNIQISLRDAGNTLIASGGMGEFSKIEDIPVVAGLTYFFEVTGSVPTPFESGYYTFAAVAAVPEPQTVALMLGGLGFVGWVAARRRRAA